MAFKLITLALLAAIVCAQQQQQVSPQVIQQQQNNQQQQQLQQQQLQQMQQQQLRDLTQQQRDREQQQRDLEQNQRDNQNNQQQDQADRYESDPQYDYSYIVQDNLTGDNKQQEESRRGGRVRGQYSLIDADGFRRIVDYRADDFNGFNAEVRREPIGVPQRIQQRIEQRIEQVEQNQQNQQIQQNQQQQRVQQTLAQNQNQASIEQQRVQQTVTQNQNQASIEQQRQSIQNTIQRIEVPVSSFQTLPRSIYTIQEFIAPSYSAVRQSINRQDENANGQQQESRYQARLTFRSPGVNYSY
uniref:CSON007158 protein n=1 Tax=Culicoides sonorensis TaxID=179676 RepID=A0A336LX53_CULSO